MSKQPDLEKQTKVDSPQATSSELEAVYLDLYGSLKKVCSKYLKRPEDIEDIVQETFVKTFEANKKSRIRSLKAYFLTTAKNLSIKHQALHANKLTDYLEDLDILEVLRDEIPLDAVVEAHEQFSIFCEAVRDLPLQCRRVFILKKIYGLSHEEISQRLDITVGTATLHLARGIARCTIYMEEHGYLVGKSKIGKKITNGK
jgi:RNA polymerase sigma factor (sigma-70 family)